MRVHHRVRTDAPPLKRRATTFVLALALSLAPTLPGRMQAQDPVIRSNVNLVLVDATVRDKSGRVMPDLKKDDFLLYDEGMQQEIAHFSKDELPLAVALVVDLSGSIRPFLRPLQYATFSALRALKSDDQVALFTFSSDVEILEDLTTDKRRVADHIESLDAGGGTNINDALFLAAEYLRKEAPKARRVIILISDNVATDAGTVEPADVLNEALEGDAVIYSIRVPGRNPIGGRIIMGATGRHLVNVPKIAAETGGEVFEVEREGSLYLAFQTVIERLKTRYTIGFYPTNNLQDGRFRRLDVKLNPRWGAVGSDYTLLAKRGYYSPRPSRASR